MELEEIPVEEIWINGKQCNVQNEPPENDAYTNVVDQDEIESLEIKHEHELNGNIKVKGHLTVTIEEDGKPGKAPKLKNLLIKLSDGSFLLEHQHCFVVKNLKYPEAYKLDVALLLIRGIYQTNQANKLKVVFHVHHLFEGQDTSFWKDFSPRTVSKTCTLSQARPLNILCCSTVYNILQVDTPIQTFTGKALIEIRKENVLTIPLDQNHNKDERLDRIRSALEETFQLKEDKIKFLNLIESKQKHCWTGFSRRFDDSKTKKVYDWFLKMEILGVFSQKMNLHYFPFDTQLIHFIISLGVPANLVVFGSHTKPEQNKFISSVYQLGNTFRLLGPPDLAVKCIVSTSDARESRSGIEYPRCTVQVRLKRKSEFFVFRVYLPVFAITALSLTSLSLNVESVSEKLLITLTILLTLAAYSIMMASIIPQVNFVKSESQFLVYSPVAGFS